MGHTRAPVPTSDCAFCSIVAGVTPAELVAENDAVVAFLDRLPLFPGHVLVVPRPHLITLAELPPDLLSPFFGAVQAVAAALPARSARRVRSSPSTTW